MPMQWRESLIARTAVVVLASAAAGCTTVQNTTAPAAPPASATAGDNPLLAEWSGPYGGTPLFDRVEVRHFEPALEASMAETLAEVERIASNPETPSFESITGNPGLTGTTGGSGGPGGGGGGGFGRGLSLTINEVGTKWPLIRYLADDLAYFERYKAEMCTFYETVFTESQMDALFDKYHGLISPCVVGANGEQPRYMYMSGSVAFTNSLAELKTHVRNRRSLNAQLVP